MSYVSLMTSMQPYEEEEEYDEELLELEDDEDDEELGEEELLFELLEAESCLFLNTTMSHAVPLPVT